MKPAVGRIVHYASHGTPLRAGGSQAFASQCRAAIVTAPPEYLPATFHSRGGDAISLCVLTPEGMFFQRAVLHDDGAPDGGDPACPQAAAHGGGGAAGEVPYLRVEACRVSGRHVALAGKGGWQLTGTDRVRIGGAP